jgi:hypothetical protein
VAPSPLALDKTRQHTLLATQTSAVVTTTCLVYLHPALTRTMRPSTASPIYFYACSQRVLGVTPSPLAPRPSLPGHTRQHTLLGTQTSAVAGSHDMPSPSIPGAYPDDAPIHGLTDIITPRLLSTDIGCVTAPSPLALRPHTATHTARDSNRLSNLGSGNQDTPRASQPRNIRHRRSLAFEQGVETGARLNLSNGGEGKRSRDNITTHNMSIKDDNIDIDTRVDPEPQTALT